MEVTKGGFQLKGLTEGGLSLSLNPWPKFQLSLSKFMVENPTFSISKPWPKTQLSLANPTLSLSLNPWPKTQLSLSLNPWPKTHLSLSLSL